MTKLKSCSVLSIMMLLFLNGCDWDVYLPSKDVNDCVSIYYRELNSGTYSYIVTEGVYGSRTCQYEGVYKRNGDGTITFTGGGNKRIRSGLQWHTVQIDPNMRQLGIYLHPNCRLCANNRKPK